MKVLICNHSLRNLTGSEIHCFELAEHLVALGHSVTAASFVGGEPMAAEFRRTGAEVAGLDSDLPPEWDVIWTHHVTCFAEIHARRRLRARRHVHGLLSSILPIERVPFPANAALDRKHFSLVANAPLTANVAKSVLPNGMNISVLWNLAPPPWQTVDCRNREALRTIAVVSNHPPPEVSDLSAIANWYGVQLQFFGEAAKNAVRISPDVLTPFDAVITIGKTVQYCLAAGIPVFVYDHYGGPGWLNRLNISAAEHDVYSGKCTRNRRPAVMLWQELATGFKDAVAFHLSRREWAAQRYDIGRQLDRLRLLKLGREPQPLLDPADDASALSILAAAKTAIPPSSTVESLAALLGGVKFH